MTDKQQQFIAELKTQNIVVLGAGLTGLSCVRFLAGHNICCQVNDSRAAIIDEHWFAEQFASCQLAQGAWQTQWLQAADLILLSPGIDIFAEQLVAHIPSHCQVIGDVELFCQLSDLPIIAVTGSNGKSTVVALLKHMAEALDLDFSLAGNIGIPVLDLVNTEAAGVILELSSFQLETIASMQARAATVLNISDDHLDRHHSIANYRAIKQKIYQQCRVAVVNRDDQYSGLKIAAEHPNMISFGSDKPSADNFGLGDDNGELTLMYGNQVLCSCQSLPLAGRHNALNYLAALALGKAVQWPLAAMVQCLPNFQGLAHRCQRVKSQDDIVWINDSKATNVGASIAAIEGMAASMMPAKQLIVIAGGDGKGADFTLLQAVLVQHVDYVITLGVDGDKIGQGGQLPIEHCFAVDSIEQAVSKAKQLAVNGDVVLLSPACASTDMFTNFTERGQRFIDAVGSVQEARQ